MQTWSTIRCAPTAVRHGRRERERASERGVRFPPSPSRLRIERAQLLRVLPSFLSLIYFKSTAEALGSWVFPSLYVISLLQISCEAQSGKPGDSWERGRQAPSQDSGSKIRQLPTRCLDEDCVLNLIYLWNLKKSSRQSIDLVARGWSLRKEVERHWWKESNFQLWVEQENGCMGMGGNECVNQLDCDHHHTTHRTIKSSCCIPQISTGFIWKIKCF